MEQGLLESWQANMLPEFLGFRMYMVLNMHMIPITFLIVIPQLTWT